MRCIIAGTRKVTNYGLLLRALDECGWRDEITSVVSGCAKGGDLLGETWATSQGLPILRHPANWRRDGRAAGPLRNTEMVKNADALIALWDGASNGTRDVIMKARAAGLRVFVLEYKKEEETGLVVKRTLYS